MSYGNLIWKLNNNEKNQTTHILTRTHFSVLFSGSVFADEFDQFEEMVGRLKMTCVYTSNEGIETHTWTYKNYLFTTT